MLSVCFYCVQVRVCYVNWYVCVCVCIYVYHQDPHQATFFFLPAHCSSQYTSVRPLQQRTAHVTHNTVHQIKQDFPFWNQTMGTDHVYICAHDMGTEVADMGTEVADSEVVTFDDLDLWKNAIGLVNTADDLTKWYFVPHKDISVPPHPGRGTVDWSSVGQGVLNYSLSRTTLAFMASHVKRWVWSPVVSLCTIISPISHQVSS